MDNTLGIVSGVARTETGTILTGVKIQVRDQENNSPVRIYTLEEGALLNDRGTVWTNNAGRYEFRAKKGLTLVLRSSAIGEPTNFIFEQYDVQPGVYADIADATNGLNAVSSVAGRIGDVVLTKSDVGLGNVDNTSDAAKPVSVAQQAAIDSRLPAAAVTSYTLTLLDDTSAGSARDTLGLGTAATASTGDFASASHGHSFGSLSAKPTTLSGYGITDGVTTTQLNTKLDKATITAKGDLIAGDGSGTAVRLIKGGDNQALICQSSEPTGLQWATLTKTHVGLGNVDNTSDLNKPVSTATQAALDLLAKAGSASSVGYKTLLVGASTFARAHTQYSAGSNYSRAGGVVTILANIPANNGYPPLVGQYIRVVSSETSGVDVTGLCTSSINTTGTTWEIKVADPRADKPSATNVSLVLPYNGTNTHCWPMLLNSYCGGMLDYINVSVGGTYTNEWLQAGRVGEAELYGPYDLGILNFGYGNALLSHNDPAPFVVDRILEAIRTYSAMCRWCIFVSNFGSTSVDVTGSSSTYTLGSRVDAYLKREVTRRFPSVSFVDIQNLGINLATYGNPSSAMLNGRPPATFLDSSGIHFTPFSSEVMARALSKEVRRLLPEITPFPLTSADNVFMNTALDSDNGKNPNGLKSWDAYTPVVPAIVESINIGTMPEGMQLYSDTVTVGLTATCTFRDSETGGKQTRLEVIDNVGSPTGLVIGMIYNGENAAPLTALVNNPAFQNVDLDLWVDVSWNGFVDDSLAAMYLQFVAKVGSTEVLFCAPIADWGTNSMYQIGGAWKNGFCGRLRSPSKFRIPGGLTYTDAQIQFGFRSAPNTPLGNLNLVWDRMGLTVRQALIED